MAIVRGQRTAIFPTRFLLVAATNPCPCGLRARRGAVAAREGDLARHARRLSGPLLDRIDLLVHVQRPDAERLAQEPTASSDDRARPRDRGARAPAASASTGRARRATAHMDARLLRRHVRAARRRRAPARSTPTAAGTLSARGRDRTLRLARTIADLAASDEVRREHVVAALGLSPRARARAWGWRRERRRRGVQRLPRGGRGSSRGWPARSRSPATRSAGCARSSRCPRSSSSPGWAARAPAAIAEEFERLDVDALREAVDAVGAGGRLPARRRPIRRACATSTTRRPRSSSPAASLGWRRSPAPTSSRVRARWRSSGRGGRRPTAWRSRARSGAGWRPRA